MKEFTVDVTFEFSTSLPDADVDRGTEYRMIQDASSDIDTYLTSLGIDVYDTDIEGNQLFMYCDSETDIDPDVIESQLNDKFGLYETEVESDMMVDRYYSPMDLEPDYISVTDRASIMDIEVYETLGENYTTEKPKDKDGNFFPDKGVGVAIFNAMMGEDLEDKKFEIIYKIYDRGDAIHSMLITAIDTDEAIGKFYDKMDDSMKTPIIISTKLARG